MVDEKTIARINELAHKAKDAGLSEAEKEEQAVLRQQYIDAVRENLRSQLERIDIVNPDGSIEHVADRKTGSRRSKIRNQAENRTDVGIKKKFT